jgi:hypothetical protein
LDSNANRSRNQASGTATSSQARQAISRAKSRDRSSPNQNWPIVIAFTLALVATCYALPAFPIGLWMASIGISEGALDGLLFALVMFLHLVSGPAVLVRCIFRDVDVLKWGAVILVFAQIVLGLLALAWFNFGAASWDMDQPAGEGASVIVLLFIDCVYAFVLLTYVVCAFALYAIDKEQFEAVLDWYSNTFSKDD